MTSGFFKKRNIAVCVAALCVIILAEIFICNNLYFRNAGNEEISYTLQDQEEGVLLQGMSVLDDGWISVDDNENACFEISGLDIDGKNLYIGLSGVGLGYDENVRAIDFTVEIIDESHPYYYSKGGIHTVSTLIEQTKYITLRPMGKLQAVRIIPDNAENFDTMYLDGISINPKRPMFFSVLRVLLAFLAFLLVYHLRRGSALYEIAYDEHSKEQRRISYAVLILSLIACFYMTGNLTQAGKSWAANPYDLLSHAMAAGRVDLDIDMPADEALKALEDPYVPMNRAGVNYTWDCAYYEGKYYVYYGVVPEILIYLPHYLATGRDLGVLPAGRLELGIFIIGIFFCFLELGRRFSGRIPFVTWLLLLLCAMTGMQVILLSRCVVFYSIPVIMGCALAVWGLYFWITSVEDEGKSFTARRIAAGSACMALAVGCRPQMIFAGLLAVPVFAGYFLNNLKEERKPGRTAAYLAAGCIPWAVILGLLFAYNAVRFGSPFEFGAKYNLTEIDVPRVRADFGKVIPGVFWYLFVPPKITTIFPFIENVEFTSSYTGDFFSHFSNGGFMICNPLTFCVFGAIGKKGLFENVSQKGFFYGCLAVSAVILGVNIMVGGFMPRYFCDFAPFIHFAALPALCLMIIRADERGREKLLPVISLLCIVTVLYHYLTYYIGDGGSYFNMYDREVFLRAKLLWQWWE